MKKMLLLFVFYIYSMSINAQCNTNTSICTPGIAGPFTFVSGSTQVSSCLDFWNGVTSPNYAYIILHITSSGPLNMLIDADNTVGFLDVAVFNIPAGQSPCTAIQNTANELGCNYASSSSGCNQFGNYFPCTASVPAPNVTAGQEIMIVVEDWSNVQNSIQLQLAPIGAQTGPPNPAITPVAPVCATAAAFQLIAADMGGTWSGPGTSSTGIFNPATAGIGTHTINYSVGVTPCNAASSTTITVTSAPIAGTASTTATTICGTGSVPLSLTGSSGAVQWQSGPTSTGPWTNISGATTTSYTATSVSASTCYRATVSGCGAPVNSNVVCVTVKPLPTVSGNNPTVCAGQTVTLTGSGTATSYTWNNGVTNNVAFTPAATGTYTVTGTLNGCTNTYVSTVTVNPIPTVNGGLDVTVCNGQNVTLVASGSATTYTWNNGITNNVAFTPIASGTYTVTGTLNGCTNTDAVNVTVNSIPTVNAGLDVTVCSGNPVTLTATGTAAVFTWNNSVINNVAFTPSTTTSYTVTGTLNGCTATDLVTVTVASSAAINAGLDVSICAGSSTTLQATGGVTYNWNNGLGNGNNFSVSPTITTTYTVSGTDVNNCSGSDQVTITVNPIPAPVINGPTSFCNGSNPIYTTTPTFSNYLWSNGNTTASPSNLTQADSPLSVSVTINGCTGTSAPFPFTVSTQINTANTITICQGQSAIIHGVSQTVAGVYPNTVNLGTGCDSVSTITLVVNPLPTINAGLDQAVCNGQSVTLTNAGNATSYSWSNSVVSGNAFIPSSTTTYTLTGTLNGCTNTDQVTITVNPIPTVNAGLDQSLCNGQIATLNASGTATTYTWNNGVVNATPFSVISTTTYTVTGTLNGCTAQDQVVVTANPIPIVSAGTDITICSGQSITLTGSGATTYSWDNGAQNGVSFIPSASQTYTVTGTSNGCTSQDQMIVTVSNSVAIDFVADTLFGCAPLTVILTNNTANSSNCTWTLNNGVTLNGCGPVSVVLPSGGLYSFTLDLLSNGCPASLTKNNYIEVVDMPEASFVASTYEISNLSTSVQFTNQSTNAYSYEWNFGDGSMLDFSQNPENSYPDSIGVSYLVTLKAFNNFGCVDSTFAIIKMNEELIFYIPNTFTPDNDEFNNEFKPIFTSGFDPFDYQLLIFNRWGEVVFESRDTNFGWLGDYGLKGIKVQKGAYTWKIEFKTTNTDERKSYSGHVNIIR